MATKRRTNTRTQLTTVGTDLRSIVRFDSNNFNSLPFSFILDEALQLKEAPVTNPIIHSLSSSLFPDTFQVFHYNLVSIKFGNNVFTDIMVNPSHVAIFSSRYFLEQSLTGQSAFALKFTTQEFEFPFSLFDFAGIEKLAVGSDCQVVYSAVNTKNSILDIRAFGSNCFRECEQEETSTFFIHPEKALSDIPTEIFFVTVRDSEGDFNPSFDSCQRQDIVLERSRTRKVISHRTSIDSWLGFSLLDHSTGLFDTSDSELALQSVTFESGINEWMQFDIIPYLILPCSINAELQSFSIDFESLNYLGSCSNLDFSCCSDVHKGCKTHQIYKYCGSVMRKVEGNGNVYNLLSQVHSSSSSVSRLSTPRKITDTSIPPNLKRLGILEVFI